MTARKVASAKGVSRSSDGPEPSFPCAEQNRAGPEIVRDGLDSLLATDDDGRWPYRLDHTVPVEPKPSLRFSPAVRSHSRPAANGPRSITFPTAVRPR